MVSHLKSLSWTWENDNLEIIRGLVRGELAAKESYQIALKDPCIRQYSGVAVFRNIALEHEKFAQLLNQFLSKPIKSGPWGVYAKAVTATAQWLGKIALLNALKEGEEFGLLGYDFALGQKDLDLALADLVSSVLIPRTREHIRLLTRMLESEISSGFMER